MYLVFDCFSFILVFSATFVAKATTFGAWLGGNVYILHRLKDYPDLLIDYVKYGIIPTGILVCCVAFGSIKLTLRAETLDALDEFWRRFALCLPYRFMTFYDLVITY